MKDSKKEKKQKELKEMRRRNCCWYYLCSCFNYDDSRQVHKEIKKKMKEFIEENASRKSKNCKHKK